jgi:DNA-binding NarL/FixJ family response regulator
MDKISVLIVDDSPFSQKMIKDALANSKYEVCGWAGTGSEGIAKYRELHPGLVTMDLTLPDMNGLDCSKEILTIDPGAKIILLSAMKDEALINRGTSIGVKGFFQKPVKSKELLAEMQKILAVEEDIVSDKEHFLQYFVAAFENNIMDMAGMSSEVTVVYSVGTKSISHGFAVIIGITGSRQGRVMIDLTMPVAKELAKKLSGTESISDDDLFNSIAEFSNIIAGHSVSQINNYLKGKEFEIRITPPSILIGESVAIINPKMASNTVAAQTIIGSLHMNVGFVGGE